MTQNFRDRVRPASAQFNARVEENIGGMRVVQAFANEDARARACSTRDNDSAIADTKLAGLPTDGRLEPGHDVSGDAGERRSLVMVAGTWFVLHGRAVGRRVRGVPAAGGRVLPPGREDQRRAGDISQGHRRLSQRYLRADRHRARRCVDRPSALPAPGAGAARSVYDRVGFGYAPGRPVLRRRRACDIRRRRNGGVRGSRRGRARRTLCALLPQVLRRGARAASASTASTSAT